MARLVSKHGVRVNVADEKVEGLLASGNYKLPAATSPSRHGPRDDRPPHSGGKIADLKAEIERRNEGREDAAKLSVDGNKAALVAVLEADDAAIAAAAGGN